MKTGERLSDVSYSGQALYIKAHPTQEGKVLCSVSPMADAGKWVLKTDSSCGYEFNSPVAYTYEDLQQFHKPVFDALVAQGNTADRSCGLHVHFGKNTKHPEGAIEVREEKFLTQLAAFGIRYEQAIFSLVTPMRRAGTYNRPISPEAYNGKRVMSLISNYMIPRLDRYTWLNLHPIGQGERDAFEIRLHQGTISFKAYHSWTLILLHLFSNLPEINMNGKVRRTTSGIELAIHNMLLVTKAYGGKSKNPALAEKARECVARKYQRVNGGQSYRTALNKMLKEKKAAVEAAAPANEEVADLE